MWVPMGLESGDDDAGCGLSTESAWTKRVMIGVDCNKPMYIRSNNKGVWLKLEISTH